MSNDPAGIRSDEEPGPRAETPVPAADTTTGTPPSSTSPGPNSATSVPITRSLIFDPTTDSSWIQPKYAVWVVGIVAIVILGILGFAISEIDGGTTGTGASQVRTADPNAGTIAALAAAAFTALSTLTAAYFGIKVASDQSERSAATTSMALQVADNAQHGNSTANGNPTSPDDF